MATRTVRVTLAGSYTGIGYHLLRTIRPIGAFTVTDIRYYCDTVSAYSYPDVVIHALNTDWDNGRILQGESGQTTLKVMESAPGTGTYFIGDGYEVATPLTSGQPYSANHEVASGKYGAILIQGNKATGAQSTKVSSSPQTHNTSGAAIAALPAPDTGHVRLGYQTVLGPWTANTSNAIAGINREFKRDSGATAWGCLNEYLEYANGQLIVDSVAGSPYNVSAGNECIALNLYADENLTFTGGWLEVTYEDESEDAYTARGEARGAAVVGYTTAPQSYILPTSRGEARAVGRLISDAFFSATSAGQSRSRAMVRNDPGLGDARLNAITSEVLYADERGPAKVTNVQVNLVGVESDQAARVTDVQVQLQGNQDPEGMEAKATHLNVSLQGNQNPELMAARLTWLSVQVLRVRGAPDLPIPPVRQGGCTMYNVIRAGEEESGQNATRGTYRRLSGDIFLYRRELLQRLRMAYFDAEDYSFTLTIPQGGP